MVKKLWRYVKPFSSDTGTLRADGRTDRQTDRFAISISRVSMMTRDKNSRVVNVCAAKWKRHRILQRVARGDDVQRVFAWRPPAQVWTGNRGTKYQKWCITYNTKPNCHTFPTALTVTLTLLTSVQFFTTTLLLFGTSIAGPVLRRWSSCLDPANV